MLMAIRPNKEGITRLVHRWATPKVLLADIINRDRVMDHRGDIMEGHKDSMLMIGGVAGLMGLWVLCWRV
jgi:hypothetical protein